MGRSIKTDEMAKLLRLPVSTWGAYERSTRVPANIPTLSKIVAKATGVDWRWLAGVVTVPVPPEADAPTTNQVDSHSVDAQLDDAGPRRAAQAGSRLATPRPYADLEQVVYEPYEPPLG